MRIALEDLGFAKVIVLYLGSKRYPLADKAEVRPLNDLCQGILLFAETTN